MVVVMGDVSFECGLGLLTEFRRNLVIRVYIGSSSFNKWIFWVHLCKGTCTCMRHGDTVTTEGLVGSGVRQGSSGDIDGIARCIDRTWERLTGGPTRGGELVGPESVGTESVGVDELTAAPRCIFTLLFHDDAGNKLTAGLDKREAVGPVIVGGSSEAV
jgi:hypothetical protein